MLAMITSSRHWSAVCFAAIASAVVLAVATEPLAAHGTARLRVSSPSVARGGLVRVTGSGAADPGGKVAIALEKDGTRIPLGEAVADKEGAFTAQVTIPQEAPLGSVTISGTGADGTVKAKITILRGADATPKAEGMKMGHAAMGHEATPPSAERAAGTAPGAASGAAAAGPQQVEGRADDMPLAQPRSAAALGLYLALVLGGSGLILWVARVRRGSAVPSR